MNWLTRNKYPLVFFFTITAVYFLVRLPNLTVQPIFADEAIYVRWAQVMRAEATLRFLPLSDGKTPLFMWMLMPLFKVFDDPLYAGRFLSVFSGYITMLGVIFLGWKFFKKQVGLIAALLVALTPYTVFFDRMALVDSMLAAFSIWALILSLLVVKYQRFDLAMVLGYLLGGAMLTKTPGFFNILTVPTSLAIFHWKVQNGQTKLIRLSLLWLIAFAISYVMYNILRLGPGFDNLSSRNQDYIFAPTRLLEHPFDPLVPHIRDLQDFAAKFLGIPLTLVAVFSIINIFLRKNWTALAIFLWLGSPLLVEMLLLKTFTARYILFCISPLLVLAAWAVDTMVGRFKGLWWKLGLLGVLGVLIAWPVYFDFLLLSGIQKVPLPANERRGYLEDWTAGYHLKDIAQFLINEAQKGDVVVGTEGTFGTLPDGLLIYLDKYLHSGAKGYQIAVVPGKATVSADLIAAAKDHPTYFVSNASRFPQFSMGVELLQRYPKAKPTNPRYTLDEQLLFKVKP